MKRLLCILLSAVFLFTLTACGEKEVPADYQSVQEAISAARAGTDITGKTIRIDMFADSNAGIIYDKPDTDTNANILVTIITNDQNRNEVLGLKKGDTVVVTVDTYDDHLKYSIYIYALDYTIY
jgi:hypothetical protein